MKNDRSSNVISSPQTEINSYLEMLSARGVKRGHLKELLRDSDKLKAVARTMINTCGLSSAFVLAADIMGENLLRKSMTRETEMDIPFPRDILKSLKDTHVLFWGNGLTVSQMSSKYQEHFFDDEPDPDVPSAALFEAKLEKRWHLVSKVPFSGSAGKRFMEQVRLVPKGRSAASVREIVWMSILLAKQDPYSLYKLCDGGKYINCHEAYDEVQERISRISVQFIGDPPVIDFEPTMGQPSIGFLDSVRPYV